MNEVSQQWRLPQGQPPEASCSCASCVPLSVDHMAQPDTGQHESGVPSGNLPTTRVRRWISRFNLSMTLLVWMRVQCYWGNHSRSGLPQPRPSPFPQLLQLHRAQFFYHSFGLRPGNFLALLLIDHLSILTTSFTLERGITAKILR